MPIPLEITALFERLNQELEKIEQETVEGLDIVRAKLAIAPNSIVLIQLFATINNYVFFVENTKRRIQMTLESVSREDVTDEDFQEAGEDLSEQLGRVLEAKVVVNQIKTRLEN